MRAWVVVIAACGYPQPLMPDGPGGSGDSGVSGQITVGGTVTGMDGTGLVLQNNGGDDKPIVSNGGFVFPTPVVSGAAYAVTASVQPTNPSDVCTVANGSGTATAAVTDVQVTCTIATYSIGGTAAGAGNLALTDTYNGGTDTLNATNGTWVFSKKLISGEAFSVSANPTTCRVLGGNATVGDRDVTSVAVNCTGNQATIAGTITGLNGTVQLKNSSNNDTVLVSGNGSFAFPMPVAPNTPYSVSIVLQPTYPPASQTCTVTNGSGTASGDVTNIQVTCTTNQFSVGGTASGITGTVEIQNNSGDNMTLGSINTTFTFPTKLASGTPYAVSVLSEPPGVSCTLTHAIGVVGNGNVNNVALSCK